jgi:hypothetical protein
MDKIHVIKLYIDKDAPGVSQVLLERLAESFMSIAEVFLEEGYISVELLEEEVEEAENAET